MRVRAVYGSTMDCIEEGIVTQLLPGDEAVVTATRAEACAGCSAHGTCSAMGGSGSATAVRALNTIAARRGDRVAVSLAGSAIVGAAGVLYFLPAVGLLGGAWGGHALAASRDIDPNLGAALGALGALCVSAAVIATYGRRLGQRRHFVPRITRVLVATDAGGVGSETEGG
ncbi:MAG: SoxR reducing system RseC family protein [Myxococcota bacterium]|nr:SoxR reducing system RseC family protein [Myxococcota bacterium]